MYPAGRFFEIDTALKRTMVQGIEEKALELVLGAQSRDPFYMVGRMGDPLNPKLIRLIDKKLDSGNLVKLDQRLKKIQKTVN